MKSLQEQFEAYVKKQELPKSPPPKDKWVKVKEFMVVHADKIEAGKVIATALTEAAFKKTPLALLEGAFDILNNNSQLEYAQDFFSPINGWEELDCDGSDDIQWIFDRAASNLNGKNIPTKFDKSAQCRILETPIGQIGYVKHAYTNYFYFKSNELTNEQVLRYLIDETIKGINSPIFSLSMNSNQQGRKVKLNGEKLIGVKSSKTDEYVKYLERSFSKGINRSLLFYGVAGTGKSTLAHSLLRHFNFRTLKFKYSPNLDFQVVKFIINHFNIEAVLIDDFDHISKAPEDNLLEFLELANEKTKLVVALANSLEAFHHAIIRPKRFDEIIKIEKLDDSTIQEILGPLYSIYGHMVQHWPVAYISELVNKSQLVSEKQLEETFKDLDGRVKKQMKDLKE